MLFFVCFVSFLFIYFFKAGAATENVTPTAFMVVTASAGAQVLNVDGNN